MNLVLGFALVLAIALFTMRSREKSLTLLLGLILLSLVPLPNIVAPGVYLAGGVIYWADLLGIIVLATAAGVFVRRFPALTGALAIALFMIVVYSLVGAMSGADMSPLVRDIRGPLRTVEIVAGTLVAISRYGIELVSVRLLRLGAWIAVWTGLTVVTVMATADSIFSLRSESASLFVAGSGFDYGALRVTPGSGLACALFAAIAVALLLKSQQFPISAALLVAGLAGALFTLGTSYTRGHVVVFLIVAAGFLIALPRSTSIGTGLARAITAMLFAGIAALGILLFFPEGVVGIQTSIDAFYGRVINGLSPEVISTDSSAMWRVRESAAAVASLNDHPIAGTGFGVPYRPFLFMEIFSGTDGLTYVHNMYLWVAVKTGWVGATLSLVALAILAGRLLIGAAKHRDRWSVAALSVFVALGVQAATTPIAAEPTNSVTVGLLVAYAWMLPLLARQKHERSIESMASISANAFKRREKRSRV